MVSAGRYSANDYMEEIRAMFPIARTALNNGFFHPVAYSTDLAGKLQVARA